jgi:hypothetical protein
MHKIQTVNLEGRIYSAGYRVLTKELKSLGLRNNSNIIQYPLGQWYFLPKAHIKEGSDDWGGMWVTRTLGDAKRLADYMKQRHQVQTRLFKAAIDKILYVNSYRMKTNGICLIEELRC